MGKYDVKEIEPLIKLDFINKMGESYLNAWIKLVEHYAPLLNEGPLIRKTAYTNHDFSHHCKDIYAIIDSVLLKNIDLKAQEYFVLAVAVLLHDISMTQEHFDRLCHSKQSADFVQKESTKTVWKDVPIQDVSIIKHIIVAHSDIKEKDANGEEKISEFTLRDIPDEENGDMGEEIQVKWLAGVLRLADELDITNSRIGNADNRYQYLNLDDGDENESYYFWEYLNYFKEVTKDRVTINLILNEQYLAPKINNDKANIIKNIEKVHKKIEDCLNEVNDYAFDSCEKYFNKIKIKWIKIVGLDRISTKEKLNENIAYFDEPQDLIQMSATSESVVVAKDSTITDKNIIDNNFSRHNSNVQGEPIYLNPELGKNITNFIHDNGLILYGHYRLNRRFCGSDWVDVRTLLSNNEISVNIIQEIVSDLGKILCNQTDKNILLIGISMNGNILASRTAFQLNLPFSYLIPTKPGTIATEMENTFKLNNCKKVVLFSGVISSYETITNMINEYMPNAEIIRIYTVLWRKIEKDYKLSEELEIIRKNIVDKVVYLNKDFPCEILSIGKCLCAKYGKCIAKNKQAYDEIYEWPLAVKDSVSNRVFVNNIIGCDLSCKYCYLQKIGLLKREKHTVEEVIAEFERIHNTDSEIDIISIGCYGECMSEDNLSNMERLIKYFSERNFYIQISTKKEIPFNWIKKVNDILKFSNQLNIFVSLPTLSHLRQQEPYADSFKKRTACFEYISQVDKIKLYIYIKPYLDEITNEDTAEYIDMAKKYEIDIVVGNAFQFSSQDGNSIYVGRNRMYEEETNKIDDFTNNLSQSIGTIYRHSIEPIRENMKKRNG